MRRIALKCLFLLASLCVPAWVSACCTDFPFERQLTSADVIFVATIEGAHAVRTSRTIVTHYDLRDVGVLKGDVAASSIRLAQIGGRVGDTEIWTSIGVQLKTGRRYVVFAYLSHEPDFQGSFEPQACGWGPFGIWPDSGNANPVVHLGDSGAIMATGERHLVVLRTQSWESAYPIHRPVERSSGIRDVWEDKPPRRALMEEVRVAQARAEAQVAPASITDMQRQQYLSRVRMIELWPHQDDGSRITEDDFVDWLRTKLSESGQAPVR